jgi:hypothetical protein
MKYFGVSDEPKYLFGEEYLPMAKSYWGPIPLPAGAEIIGGYSDNHRAGALIELANGNWVCGSAGSISAVPLKPTTTEELREARQAAGLTMVQAADLSGTPYRTWQDWETGKRRVPGIARAWLRLYAKQHRNESP